MNKFSILGVVLIVLLVVGFITSKFYKSSPQIDVPQDEQWAINMVITQYPELERYRTTSLPPSSIKGEKIDGDWHTSFLQSGSGVDGILNAKCFKILNDKDVTIVGEYVGNFENRAESINLKDCSPIYPAIVSGPISAFGDVSLKLGETVKFKGVSIKLISIEEDSRCPVDVQCIQAGTVRVKAEIVSGMGTSTSILKLGELFTTEAENITLKNVLPNKNSKITVSNSDYTFVINVVKRVIQVSPIPVPQGACYVGGCSSQVCSDQQGMVSTCEYREEYACYKLSKCERQSNGKCGWTENASLRSCLVNSR